MSKRHGGSSSSDRAHLQVLEAMLVVLILLGAIFAMIQFRLPATERDQARAGVERVAADALILLDGLKEVNGSVLELALAEAMHCNADAAQASTACYAGRGRNLSLKLDSYLAAGSAYMVGLGNGATIRELWRDVEPSGEAIESRFALAPSWNLTFVAVDLSCHEAGVDVNVSLVPIRQGNLSTPTSIAATASNAVAFPAERAASYGVWNATMLAATRPASGIATASVTARGGTFPGSAAHSECALEGVSTLLRDAVKASSLGVLGPAGDARAALSQEARFEADLSAFLTIPGAVLGQGNVTVYEPLPPRGWEPDSFAPAVVLPLPPGANPSTSWTVPADSLYGAHPVLLRQKVTLTLPSTAVIDVEARLVGVLDVALPGGIVPVGAPYDVVLQVWFPDWR